MNQLYIYLFFNQQYKHLNKNNLLLQYKKDINNPTIIKNFDDFKNKYPDFDHYFYDNLNKLELKDEKKIILHWLNYGVFNHFISSKKQFYEIYNFDTNHYKNKYNLDLNEDELIIHYFQIGKYLNYTIHEETKIELHKQHHQQQQNQQNQQNQKILEKDNQLINSIDHHQLINSIHYQSHYNEIENSIKNICYICHLFVHFFKCGGGEVYINNFLDYYPKLNHYIFLNSKYNNYINEKIKNNSTIVYYDSSEELKILLNKYNFDIIIDHQYYLFHSEELEIKQKINIIHSVDYYQEELHIKLENDQSNQSNQYINLYVEKTAKKSWNHVIKHINYLGINPINHSNQIIKKLNNIYNQEKYEIKNIAIIGRIDEHKINPKFIDFMILYSKKYKNKINFNIYGNIEENYKKYFLKKINNQQNIFIHGFIDYHQINEIYIKNDLVLSASKSEAGGTIILEAMNNGCLVIARNKGGNKETIQNNDYLINGKMNGNIYENDYEYFNLIETIKNKNSKYILLDILFSKKKILLLHNNENHYYHLLNQISIFTNIQKNCNHQYPNEIPNIVHYIYGLKEQNTDFSTEFPFLFYFGILSNILINQPIQIYFHYQYLPFGYWWDKIKKYLTLNYVNYSELIFQKVQVKVKHYAHKSDYLRLMMLYQYGGIYYDIDTLCVRPHHDLLKNNELVLGIQEKYKNEYDLFGNAIIMSKKGNSFIKLLLINFENYFDNDEWTKASLFMPTQLYNNLNEEEKEKIVILEKEYFYYPNYNEKHLIYELKGENINKYDKLMTFHYCNHSSEKYIENINADNFIEYINNNNLFGNLMKHINNIYLNQLNQLNQTKNIEQNKQNKQNQQNQQNQQTKIYIFNQSNEIENKIKEIINNENEYLILNNINICIFSLTKITSNNKFIINKYCYLKNINIYFIELFEEINNNIKKNICILLIYQNYLNNTSIDIKYCDKLETTEKIEINKDYFIYHIQDLIQIFHIKSIYYK